MAADVIVILADHEKIITVDSWRYSYPLLSPDRSIAHAIYYLLSRGYELKEFQTTYGNYGVNGIHYSYYIYIFMRPILGDGSEDESPSEITDLSQAHS
jgi:hypothetical protein